MKAGIVESRVHFRFRCNCNSDPIRLEIQVKRRQFILTTDALDVCYDWIDEIYLAIHEIKIETWAIWIWTARKMKIRHRLKWKVSDQFQTQLSIVGSQFHSVCLDCSDMTLEFEFNSIKTNVSDQLLIISQTSFSFAIVVVAVWTLARYLIRINVKRSSKSRNDLIS